MSTVKNIFEAKQKTFNRIEPTALVIEALGLLNSINISYLVVMEGDQYKGIFGEREYARNVILKGRASNTTFVKDAMTTDLPMVDFNDSFVHCMYLMNSHKVRYLLAYDNNKFKGVITIHDLLRQTLVSKDEHDKSVTDMLIENDENSRFFW